MIAVTGVAAWTAYEQLKCMDSAVVDYREHPELYRVGRGEQGVLLVEPYKGELLPHWRFKTPPEARKSARTIYQKFLDYKRAGDFVGMDMARKYLQMGYTRARRYANHKSGKKFDGPVPEDKKGQSGSHGRNVLPLDPDPVKAESARIFYEWWKKAREDKQYQVLRAQHRKQYG